MTPQNGDQWAVVVNIFLFAYPRAQTTHHDFRGLSSLWSGGGIRKTNFFENNVFMWSKPFIVISLTIELNIELKLNIYYHIVLFAEQSYNETSNNQSGYLLYLVNRKMVLGNLGRGPPKIRERIFKRIQFTFNRHNSERPLIVIRNTTVIPFNGIKLYC